jgi:hypothetical protein
MKPRWQHRAALVCVCVCVTSDHQPLTVRDSPLCGLPTPLVREHGGWPGKGPRQTRPQQQWPYSRGWMQKYRIVIVSRHLTKCMSSLIGFVVYWHYLSIATAHRVCIHSVFCLTTGPKPLPKRVLQKMLFSAFSILSFPQGHPVSTYIFLLVFLSLLLLYINSISFLEGISYTRCDQSVFLSGYFLTLFTLYT